MNKKLIFTILVILFSPYLISCASAEERIVRFGETLCSQKDKYDCITVEEGQSWKSLWPNEEEREKIQRINRVNMELEKGLKIAVPKNLDKVSLADFSPFPDQIKSSGKKQIMVNLNQLAWGAYDTNGKLLKWGPASGGQDWCQDVNEECRTPEGEYTMQYKSSRECESGTFQTPEGDGAPMPYCMFFYKGYALHGSYEVPGYNASHGCVRTFPEDAKWLNEEFIDLPIKKNSYQGTTVMIQSYQIARVKVQEAKELFSRWR